MKMKTYKTFCGPDVTVESARSFLVGDEMISFKRDADVASFCADFLSKIPLWDGELDDAIDQIRRWVREDRRR